MCRAGFCGPSPKWLQRNRPAKIPTAIAEKTTRPAAPIQTPMPQNAATMVVAQKTVGDLGPAWDADMYFKRVSARKEIAR